MRHQTYQKRADDRFTMELKLQKKEEKINKFAKKHDEELKDRVEKIQATKEKWTTRVDTHHNHLKTVENTWFK